MSEIDRLRKNVFDNLQEIERLNNIINKAIEYIKEHIRVDDEYPGYMEMLVEEKNELLNILKGEDNEDN